MNHAQAMLATVGGGASIVALVAGWRESVRKRRLVLDAAGWMPWPTVQFLALVVMAACAWLAVKIQ